MNKRNKAELNKVKKHMQFSAILTLCILFYAKICKNCYQYYMNFITKPLSNTNVYSDKLQIVKSKKKNEKTDFL